MSDEERALLRAILSSPEDDTVRLVYADWLDDHGQGERAELIRVQVELARLERRQADLLNDDTDWARCGSVSDRWCPNCGECTCRNPEESLSDKGCPLHDPDSPHACLDDLKRDQDALRRRERELLDRHWREWAPRIMPDGIEVCANLIEKDRPEPRVEFRRGFVSHVSCDLRTFAGGPCARCRGEGMMHPVAVCQVCHDDPDYRTPGVAPALFACQPVEQVTLTDREPWSVARRTDQWRWWDARANVVAGPEDRSNLTGELFDVLWEMFPEFRHQDSHRKSYRWLEFPTRAAALAALSRACVAWGRSVAEGCRHGVCETCGGSGSHLPKSAAERYGTRFAERAAPLSKCGACDGTGQRGGLPPLN